MRLIAAAPELLAELRLMVSPIEHHPSCLWKANRSMPCQCGWHDRINTALKQARAVIAKAEGTESMEEEK